MLRSGSVAVVMFALAAACSDDGPPPAPDAATDGTSTGPGTVPDLPVDPTLGGSSGADGDSGTDTTGAETGEDPCAATVEPGRLVNWSQYGLDAANSRSNPDETVITAANVHCLEPIWRRDDLAGVTSTAAVVGDLVVFGEWDGDVHVAGAGDGRQVWTTNVGAPVNDSPLVDRNHVYVGDADGSVHALDLSDGTSVWSVELDAHPDAGIYSSPVIVDGMLIIGVSSVELASVHDDYTFRGSVVGLDAATGEEQWRLYTTDNSSSAGAGVSVWSSAAVDNERGWIYIGSGNTYEEPASPLADSVLAIEAATGALQWSTQFTTDDVFTIFGPAAGGDDADVGAAPNLFTTRAGRDLVGVGDKAGFYRALDRDTGAILWINEVGPGDALGGIMTTAAVADGVIYVSNNEWPVLYEFGNNLNTGKTVAISIEGGATLWEAVSDAPIFGALTVAGGVVYHGTVRGDVVALDAQDGSELWRTEPGQGIGGGFSVANGRLYVGHGFWFLVEPANPFGGFVAYGLP